MIDAVRDSAERISDAATRQAQSVAFKPAPRNPERDAQQADAAETERTYAQTFGAAAVPIAIVERVPTAEVTSQARRLARQLQRAQYRAVSRTKVRSITPPGRMRMSEAMRAKAQRASGVRVTATPWKETRRRQVPNPPLTVGFSGDVSGSMQEWQTVTADLSWAVAQAVKHLHGTTAAVAWNSEVAPTLRPRETPAEVQEARCGGGSAGCATSLRALDGALHLTTRVDGARVVVVVTDGHLGDTYGQINSEVARLTRSGVKVLWVTPTPDARVDRTASKVVLSDPSEFGEVIGRALADLLSEA